MSSEKKNKSSLIVTIAIYGVFILASCGAGFAVSGFIAPAGEDGAEKAAMTDAKDMEPKDMEAMADGGGKDTKGGKDKGKSDSAGKSDDYDNLEAEIASYKWTDLPPLTTNIGEPSSVWARVELSLASKKQVPEDIASRVAEEILIYMRTVKLTHVSKPSGFRYFLEDVREIAAVNVGPDFVEVFPTAVIFE